MILNQALFWRYTDEKEKTGKANRRRYKDGQGIERYATDIIGETLQFLDSKKCAGKSNVHSTNLRKPAPANNEDVPF